MIEDPQITVRILKHFADNLEFPAHARVESLLKDIHPKIDEKTLKYHLYVCIENELLVGKYRIVTAFEGSDISIGVLEGLTPKGGDYVRDSDSHLWERARQSLIDQGIAVTTSRLVELIARLVQTSITSGQ